MYEDGAEKIWEAFSARWCCNPCRISDARWISGAGVDRTSNTAGNGATICVEQMMQKDQKLRDVEFIQWCWEVLQGVETCLCRHRAKRALMPGWLQPFPSCKMRRLADAGPLGHQCEGHVRIIHPISINIRYISQNQQVFQQHLTHFKMPWSNSFLSKCGRPTGRSFLASPLQGTLNMPLVSYMSGSPTLPIDIHLKAA